MAFLNNIPTALPDLTGKVALVTGSARRNGKAIARRLAAAGASVVITSHTAIEKAQAVADEIVSEHGAGRAIACLADVTDPTAVTAMVEQTIATLKRLDILINNASIRLHSPIEQLSLDDWHKVLRTILDGAFLCSKAAAPHLARHGHGIIINIGGASSHVGGRNNLPVMTAKQGIIGLTRALAYELGPKGITVNCVSPGLIMAPDDPPKQTERMRAVFRTERVPLGRLGDIEELAAAVVALCDPAWSYMSGQVIHVNGGVHLGS
jgi:3-oxoacyl-[acyl-carrier protein] reductase